MKRVKRLLAGIVSLLLAVTIIGNENLIVTHAAVLAVTIAKATIDEMVSFVDGFYLITPFHRVEIMQQIIAHIQQMDD